jgi:hypothetical protein
LNPGESGQSGDKINLGEFIEGEGEEKKEEGEEAEKETATLNLNIPLLTGIAGIVGSLGLKKPENRIQFLTEFNQKFPEYIKQYGLEDVFQKLVGVEIEIETPEEIKVKLPWYVGLVAVVIALGVGVFFISKKYREQEAIEEKKQKPKLEEEKKVEEEK